MANTVKMVQKTVKSSETLEGQKPLNSQKVKNGALRQNYKERSAKPSIGTP